jgi:hypothetical protein
VFLVGLVFANYLTAAASVEDDGIVRGSSTGNPSCTLKWLPYRSESGTRDAEVIQTQYVEGESSPEAAKGSQQPSQSALDDPFGDKNSTASADTIEEPQATVTLSPAEPSLSPITPRFTNEMRSTRSISSVAQEKNDNKLIKRRNNLSPNDQPQSLEESLANKNPTLKEGCPSSKDLKKIKQLTTNIKPSAGDLPQDCPWGGDDFHPRCWSPVTFTWTASGLCHKPLYFEDTQLERYGHGLGPWLQPFASGAHFFLTVPILPYKMGLEVPDECIYDLGYYRPGDCAPYMLDPLPLSIRAGLFEAGAWVAGAAIIP